MIEIASFVGVSYTGKSTLAEGVVTRLANEGIVVDIVKKDDAMKAVGHERYGENDSSGGYSIKGFFKHGEIPPRDLHEWMNRRVTESRELGHVVLLEGGTRTRTAQAETLSGIELDEGDFRIFDSGSTSGTWVNYTPVPSADGHLLQDGDLINLGRVQLRFKCRDLAPAGAHGPRVARVAPAVGPAATDAAATGLALEGSPAPARVETQPIEQSHKDGA